MLQIDPNTIWSIGGDHSYELKPINNVDGKKLFEEYNQQSLWIIGEIDRLLIDDYLNYHFNRPICDKEKFINNLKINFVDAKSYLEGSIYNLLSDELITAINLWIEKIENNYKIKLNDIIHREAEVAKQELLIANRETALASKKNVLLDKDIDCALEGLSEKDLLKIIAKISTVRRQSK